VNTCPAIVSVPVREDVAVFAATLYPTVPLPLPLAPELMVSQVTLLVAVHAQPAATVTLTVPLDAEAPTEPLDDESAGVHATENWNGFDRLLFDDPPGPTAATRAS
jgi:hypothetical protein